MVAAPDPTKLATATVDATGLANPTQAGNLYGLNGAEQAQKYDISGLAGLPVNASGGQATAADILKAFLAAGQSSDPSVRAVAAAIQHALYYGNYYGKSTVPTFGEITHDDASAFARALADLGVANQNQAGASATGQIGGMGVSQFLTSQAAVGAANGPTGASAAVAPQVVNVRAPNAADVAATYEKVAQQLLGHRPDAADTAAFVNSYTQQYVANEKANFQAQYDATVQKAQVKVQRAAQNPTLPSSPVTDPGALFRRGEVDSINNPAPSTAQGQFLQGEIADQNQPAPGGANAPTLADNMMSLQDVINQNAQSQSVGSPSLIEAGTNAPEDVGVAAENYARNQHPAEAGAGDLNNMFGTFLSLIGAHMSGV